MSSDHQPAPEPTGRGGLRLFRAKVAYDGGAYHGWAAQPGLATVEGAITLALGRVLRSQPVAVACGGRTDAGVHATGQVIHFAADGAVEVQRLLRSVNAVLPLDIRVLEIEPAPAGFDARFAALWRRYRYRITDGIPDPLQRHSVLWIRHPLDVAAMAEAVRPLVGLHDFGSFCRPREGATTIRHVHECGWSRAADGLVVMEIRSDAFCHSMVRSIVGASLEVGLGRRPSHWLADLVATPSRRSAAPVAAPQGLVLVEIGYPPPAALAERTAAARQKRVLADPDPDPRAG